MVCPWNPSGKNTGVGCHFLLQGIFPTQGLNSHLLRLLSCSQIFFFFFYYWATREALTAKYRLKLKKVGKTTWPFRYDLNQIPYDYTVEVTKRFNELDLVVRVPKELCELWRFVTLYGKHWPKPKWVYRDLKSLNLKTESDYQARSKSAMTGIGTFSSPWGSYDHSPSASAKGILPVFIPDEGKFKRW